VDTEVKIPASRSLNVGRGDGFTLGAWINPDGLDQQCPIMEWNSGSGGVSFMVVEDYGAGSLYARITDVGHTDHFIISPSGLVQPYVFQHVAVTYDRLKGTGALYFNGQLVGLAFLGFFEPLTDGDLHFGLRGPGEFKITHLRGQLDELQVFNSALACRKFKLSIRRACTVNRCFRAGQPPPVNDIRRQGPACRRDQQLEKPPHAVAGAKTLP